ncbi:hypothetical protein OQJ13_11710 [Legionella sp. PATHC035]|uniref:hypothetical protein n=1 Tax=Legionella sp. PATHC035 TaxID=2992040 RepID=UPI002244ABF6|nr:hypothetical protein [Legionella sp. PATHC035]MCW8409637.1 hypothetical protein [Legionella sp. PATHC035]
MSESKIERPKLSIPLKSLDETSLEQIQKKDSSTPLSNTIKRQLWDFYNLLSDMMCRTPYFNKLPEELVMEIITRLRKDGARDEKAISTLVATHKRMHTLFQPTRLGDLTQQLLCNTVTGQQDKAERLVDMHPELQLKPGTITDYSGRTFKNITAYEYAYWAKDTHMCRMLERHMDRETKLAMLKRCEAIEKNGLTYEQHGVEVKGSKHYDMTPLLSALKNFRDRHNNWSTLWGLQVMLAADLLIVQAQRDVPVHVANEYCRKDRSFYPTPTFKEDTLPRKLKIYHTGSESNGSWFSNFNNTFLIRNSNTICLSPNWFDLELAERIDIDLAALEQLDKVRTEELAELQEKLRWVEPTRPKNCSCF